MTKETGGPAFPGEYLDYSMMQEGKPETRQDVYKRGEGMTLRDWFAGMALQGLMTQANPTYWTGEYYADWAFKTADAMLKARNE